MRCDAQENETPGIRDRNLHAFFDAIYYLVSSSSQSAFAVGPTVVYSPARQFPTLIRGSNSKPLRSTSSRSPALLCSWSQSSRLNHIQGAQFVLCCIVDAVGVGRAALHACRALVVVTALVVHELGATTIPCRIRRTSFRFRPSGYVISGRDRTGS